MCNSVRRRLNEMREWCTAARVNVYKHLYFQLYLCFSRSGRFIEVWLMVVEVEKNGESQYNVSWLQLLARVQEGWVKECLYMYSEIIEIKMTYINIWENKQTNNPKMPISFFQVFPRSRKRINLSFSLFEFFLDMVDKQFKSIHMEYIKINIRLNKSFKGRFKDNSDECFTVYTPELDKSELQ